MSHILLDSVTMIQSDCQGNPGSVDNASVYTSVPLNAPSQESFFNEHLSLTCAASRPSIRSYMSRPGNHADFIQQYSSCKMLFTASFSTHFWRSYSDTATLQCQSISSPSYLNNARHSSYP